jgi:hypothetical protein
MMSEAFSGRELPSRFIGLDPYLANDFVLDAQAVSLERQARRGTAGTA